MIKHWRIRWINEKGETGYGPWNESKRQIKYVKKTMDKMQPKCQHFIDTDFDTIQEKFGIGLVFIVFVVIALCMFIARIACAAPKPKVLMRYEITISSPCGGKAADRIGITYMDQYGDLIKDSLPIDITGKTYQTTIKHYAYKNKKWYIFVLNQSMTSQMRIQVLVYKNDKLIKAEIATEKTINDFDNFDPESLDYNPANVELGSDIK